MRSDSPHAARNPSTPPEVLALLADTGRAAVRATVAANPSTSPDVLAKLACDEDEYVRWVVAGNPAAPPEVLAAVAAPPPPEADQLPM